MEIVRSRIAWVVVVGALGSGCQPQTSCPSGLVVGEGGRCVASDGGGLHGDGGGRDAGVGPDGCALLPFYGDADGDGHGDPGATTYACAMPEGFAPSGDDCDDTCIACHPGATEICGDGRDQDCDGVADQGCGCTAGASQPCGASSVGACHLGTQSCEGGTWGACVGASSPSAEVCNAIDDDCDGSVDEDAEPIAFYPDADGDGHGDAAGTATMACTAPAGFVTSHDDCDDASAMRAPGLVESCDAIDNDCHGAADDTFACVRGASAPCTTSCGTQGTGACSASCALPTASACTPPAETCDGLDQDCDFMADEGLAILGAAQTVATGTGFDNVRIVPLGTGYLVLYRTTGTPSSVLVQAISSSGAPMGTAVSLGTNVAPYQFSARASGSHVLVAWGQPSSFQAVVVGATGTPTGAPITLPRPSGTSLMGPRVVVTDFSEATMHGTIFLGMHDTMGGLVRRVRVNFSGTPPVVGTAIDERTVINRMPESALSVQWDAITTADADYVAAYSTSGLLLLRTSSGDGVGGTTNVATLTTSSVVPVGVALAASDAARPFAETNPLAIAWQTSGGAYFLEYTGAASQSFVATIVAGAVGSPTALLYPDWIELAPVANGSAAGPHVGHWLLAAADRAPGSDTTRSLVRAWEIVHGSGGTTATALAMPADETAAAREDLSLASLDGHLRLAEQTATGIVTRQLGCR